jgi:hypothetical protein
MRDDLERPVAHVEAISDAATSEVTLDDAEVRPGPKWGWEPETPQERAGGPTAAVTPDWFEITEVRGHLADGRIEHFQVGLKVGFRLEDEDEE